ATSRYRPFIPLTVCGPAGMEKRPALVDTGADDVVFPLDVAPKIGISLANLPKGQARGVGATSPAALFYASVILNLDDGNETARWRAVVGFSPALSRWAVFGIAGGIEFFRTTVDVEVQQIELIANSSLPSTQDTIP